jgi:hypothetical protein
MKDEKNLTRGLLLIVFILHPSSFILGQQRHGGMIN